MYGHEHGLRFIWQGGRPFKQKKTNLEPEKPKVNGSKKKPLTVIDLDDDDNESSGNAKAPFVDQVFFEDESVSDGSNDTQAILQDLDLGIGSAVLCIAFPPVANDGIAPDFSYGEYLLSRRIVLAAACSDGTVRVITLPLTPPSPESKARKELRANIMCGSAGHGSWGESMVVISNVSNHTVPCSQVSITISPRVDSNDGDAAMEDAPTQSTRKRSRSRSRLSISRPPGQDSTDDWDLLVATHRPDLSGTLHLYRIPLYQIKKDQRDLDISQEQAAPWQTQYLPAPAKALSFNPSSPGAYRNVSQLLLADSKGAVRVYDCSPAVSRGRSSSRESSEFIQGSADQGCWLATFYVGSSGTHLPGNSRATPRRKAIVDAKWIFGGRAIIVLLSDGEWGIWDLEGASPTAHAHASYGSKDSVRGGSQTVWSLSGCVDLPPSLLAPSGFSSRIGTEDRSHLAPKTPNTKRAGQQQLFSKNDDSALRYIRGGIAVRAGAGSSPEEPAEEAVAIWLGDTVMITRSIRLYWSAQARNVKAGSGSLYGSSPGSMSKVEGINLRGEALCQVDLFRPITTGTTKGIPADILVTGEHRLVVMSSQPAHMGATEPSTALTQMNIDATAGMAPPSIARTGEMELDGIDATLSRMGAASMQRNGSPTKRRVGFHNV